MFQYGFVILAIITLFCYAAFVSLWFVIYLDLYLHFIVFYFIFDSFRDGKRENQVAASDYQVDLCCLRPLWLYVGWLHV